jgi:hypothetical protein
VALIVQIINRSGVPISSHRVSAERVVLGRALDSDVILQDPHVNPHHLEIVVDSATGKLMARDMSTINGTWCIEQNKRGSVSRHKSPLNGAGPFFSGQIFELGKTYVRICSTQHAVAPALPLSRWDALGAATSHWWLFVLLGVMLITLDIWDGFLSNPDRKHMAKNAIEALYPILAAGVYAGIWGLVGKIIRHDAKFTSHFTVALAGMLALTCIQVIMPYGVFNLGGWEFQPLIDAAVSGILLLILGLISLSLATHLRNLARFAIAMIAPVLIMVTSVQGIISRAEFRSAPPYDRSLVEPKWQFRQANTVEEFLSVSQDLYAQVDSVKNDATKPALESNHPSEQKNEE